MHAEKMLKKRKREQERCLLFSAEKLRTNQDSVTKKVSPGKLWLPGRKREMKISRDPSLKKTR